MSRVSQKSQARYGIPIRSNVTQEVFTALLAEAKRCNRTVNHIVSELLRYWHEDVYIPTQKGKS